MKILLLGNGFDLAYKLPTKYIDFLSTIRFLKDTYCDCLTVGDVFSAKDFYKIKGTTITYSYKKYKEIYDKETIDKDILIQMQAIVKNNMWANYFLKSFESNVGWIDFEKEISKVLNAFHILFEHNNKPNINCLKIPKNRKDILYIVSCFEYFWKKKYKNKLFCKLHQTRLLKKIGIRGYSITLNDNYRVEEPFGSENYIIDKEKILKELFEALQEFSKLLKLYLKYFVEKPFIKNKSTFELINGMKDADFVVTLNYTLTFENIFASIEKAHKEPDVFHIHGSTSGSNIVLGVNTDKDDELKTIDTSFIFFKKYYQRVVYRTDLDYVKKIQLLKNYNERQETILYVYGHSLDTTDRDIIVELFDLSKEIRIYYHNADALGSYINNLVTIFGKQEFDKLREEKNLHFVDSSDL